MVPILVSLWYRGCVDVNVKNIEPEVLARLAEQAGAEGMSQQEWIRQTLRRSSARLSPAELAARRHSVEAMSDDEFAELKTRVTKGRRVAAERLGARQRRR